MKKQHQFFAKLLIVIALEVIVFTGCFQQSNIVEGNNQPQNSVERVLFLDAPQILKMGEKVLFADAQLLRCAVDSISDDSRCPAGVNCVWEGNAILYLRLDTTGALTSQYIPLKIDLRPNVGTGNIASVGRYSVEFKELTPEAKSGLKIQQSEYRATLIFRRK